MYDFIRKWTPLACKDLRILSLDLSPTEETISISLENNNIGTIVTRSIGLNEDTEKEITFDLLSRGFHSGGIASVDVATQRPLILTCSKEDCTIRLWNYEKSTCELGKGYYVMDDDALREAAKLLIAVAMHPSGYQMAASTINKIRLYHILQDEFLLYDEIDIRYCKAMSFSRGGHLLAAVDGVYIRIFNASTLDLIHSLKMHNATPDKTIINQLVFGPEDKSIAVAGSDGYAGRWALPSYALIMESV